MGTYHTIYVTTKVQNRKKNENYYTFDACQNAREVMEIRPMAGKIKEFVLANAVETKSYGDNYNGYGWSSWYHNYLLTPTKVKELQTIIDGKKAKQKPRKTEDEIIEAWAKRLSKLTGISIDIAKDIAIEKLNAKTEQRNALINRDSERGYSTRRHALIRKIDRSNPLRRITDRSHAMNILAASYRHNHTDYDAILEDNREKAEWGEMDYEDVRYEARKAVAGEVADGVEKMFAVS